MDMTVTLKDVFVRRFSNNISVRNSIDVILRDVQKAFDKVWHDGLRYKLSQIALHPCFLRILSNYLEDRKASIRIDNHLGPPIQLRSGVPQGACLSPTLYGFFTRDIEEPPHHTDYIAYADDITQITATRSNHRYVARLTKRAIKHVNKFEKKWKIKTNTKKILTYFMLKGIMKHKFSLRRLIRSIRD